eukprot:12798-Heterococcus_DN1.PRE.5
MIYSQHTASAAITAATLLQVERLALGGLALPNAGPPTSAPGSPPGPVAGSSTGSSNSNLPPPLLAPLRAPHTLQQLLKALLSSDALQTAQSASGRLLAAFKESASSSSSSSSSEQQSDEQIEVAAAAGAALSAACALAKGSDHSDTLTANCIPAAMNVLRFDELFLLQQRRMPAKLSVTTLHLQCTKLQIMFTC